jgi:hypothetical protein
LININLQENEIFDFKKSENSVPYVHIHEVLPYVLLFFLRYYCFLSYTYLSFFLLWRVDPLRSSDFVNNSRGCGIGEKTLVFMRRSRYCWTATIEAVFSMLFVPKCYKLGQSSSGGEDFSAVQLSEVT